MSDQALSDFASGYAFTFDDFQTRACRSLLDGNGVLVAAPTGSGKTVVGEFACWSAITGGSKCFYTTPIKALSNQKYHDLVARHGPERVGLLTGDVSINSEADVVVMTTEVLRNMLYASSPTLDGLGYVVMDEVHYLADRFRGAVWEEVILGLPAPVQLVCLSATVSNAEEFGEWLDEVRPHVEVIVSERRPVPLFQHVLVGRRIVDLFEAPGRVNPELVRLAKSEALVMRDDSRRLRGRRVRGRIQTNAAARGRDHRVMKRAPRRDGAVEALRDRDLLPAIFFVFSRQGCDEGVGHLMGSDLDLTTPEEKNRLRQIADRHRGILDEEDRRALGWERFLAAFVRGIAAHHAGLLPVFKTIVEEGFTAGLVKVVFATETLALGVNMPARTVVIEKLVKFNGETHTELTAGEFTQLTGRAGRRGIDVEGHAVVFWRPGMDPQGLARLAAKRTYPLRSSFAPNYNMAVNLTGSVGRSRARALLEQSFAQFQADRSVVLAARASAARVAQASGFWEQARCDRGDFAEYAHLRAEIGELETESARLRKLDAQAEIAESWSRLARGDVVWIPAGKHQGWAAVIQPNSQAHAPWVMTADRQVAVLKDGDLNARARAVSRVRIPRRFNPHSVADCRALANALTARIAGLPQRPESDSRRRPDEDPSAEIAAKRMLLRAHPCHHCPEREVHARFAEQALRLERGSRAPGRLSGKRNSIAARFDRICQVLESLGYLDQDRVTEAGMLLSRIYNELDLLVAEAIRAGLFNELTVPQLAAVLSTLVYESRPTDQAMHRMPDEASGRVLSQLRALWSGIGAVERDHRVERTEGPQIGFAELAHAWAAGDSLAVVLAETTMAPGDFVRWVRQVIDLAAQIAQAPGAQPLAATCRSLVRAMRRDIVDVGVDDLDPAAIEHLD